MRTGGLKETIGTSAIVMFVRKRCNTMDRNCACKQKVKISAQL